MEMALALDWTAPWALLGFSVPHQFDSSGGGTEMQYCGLDLQKRTKKGNL